MTPWQVNGRLVQFLHEEIKNKIGFKNIREITILDKKTDLEDRRFIIETDEDRNDFEITISEIK